MSAITPDDAWAVGTYLGGSDAQTLIEHWDGVAWSVVPSPGIGELWDVAAVAPDDVWAAGKTVLRGAGPKGRDLVRPLIEHWDGVGWAVVPTPDIGSTYAPLSGIAARSATDIWAVGNAEGADGQDELILHWNGSSWSRIPGPQHAPGEQMLLHAVAPVRPDDVWAVGFIQGGEQQATLAQHWDGQAWTIVPTESPGAWGSWLTGVTALSPTDAWSVGTFTQSGSAPPQGMAQHWDGTRWSLVGIPQDPAGSMLEDVQGVSPTEVWAVGETGTASGEQLGHRTLIMHWDGASWSTASSPSPDQAEDQLSSISLLPSGQAYAVGLQGPEATQRTLFLACQS
jgi:hypothetical protein